jgi:hypothetical protein
MFTIRLTLLIVVVLLVACSLRTPADSPPPTATTLRFVPGTLVPTANRQAQAVASAQPDAAITPATSGDCPVEADEPAVRHEVVANLNYAQRGLIANQQVRYVNRTEQTLDEVVFSIEANHWPDAFTLNKVMINGEVTAYTLTGRRLTIELPALLLPDCAVDVEIGFRLDVPQIGQGMNAFKGYLGHTPRQLNLSNWLPKVAPRLRGDWVIREISLIGEQTVFEVADWDVTLNIAGAPENLTVAGPGQVSRPGDRSWRFVINGSRDFSLSLSNEFIVNQARTRSGVVVELFTFSDAQVVTDSGAVLDGAAHALEVATKSVEVFSDLFGDYPYERLAVVEGDFPDGMEFSGIVFVSRDWFTRWPGRPESYLTIITVHEVAHQWWYARVGSDQALTPWLDEALATYSEYIFFEEYYPEMKDWWWLFRVDNFAPQGFVDSTVYEFSSIRDYINAVYLRGARMLHEIRDDLGTEAFIELLRAYAEAGEGRIATPDLFWSLMTQEQLQSTQATRQRYLRQPGLSG